MTARSAAMLPTSMERKQLLRGAIKLDDLRTLGPDSAILLQDHPALVQRRISLLPWDFYFDLTARMREFENGFKQGVESFL